MDYITYIHVSVSGLTFAQVVSLSSQKMPTFEPPVQKMQKHLKPVQKMPTFEPPVQKMQTYSNAIVKFSRLREGDKNIMKFRLLHPTPKI